MTYSRDFHRLVIAGTLYNDVFNVTLSFATLLPAVALEPSQALLQGVANTVDSWWNDPLTTGSTGGISIAQDAKLTHVKLNRIGPNGRYVDNLSHEYVYPAPIAGGGPIGAVPQLSLVASLRGSQPRVIAGKGRMYFPPSKATTDALLSNGTVATVTAQQYASGVASLIRSLNNVYVAQNVPAVAVIASKQGDGAFQPVTTIGVGRVIDTMRSRRNKNDEDYVEATV